MRKRIYDIHIKMGFYNHQKGTHVTESNLLNNNKKVLNIQYKKMGAYKNIDPINTKYNTHGSQFSKTEKELRTSTRKFFELDPELETEVEDEEEAE